MNKLFIVGLPRTGTTSISVSLLQHNFKVAHTAFTKRAFEVADVISDAPCFSDYKQLDQLFPGSKFVYLDRDLIDWVPSIQRLLKKMHENLHPKTGYFNPILKRSFHQTFELFDTLDPFNDAHLKKCYLNHQEQVFNYFSTRNDFLRIDISERRSLEKLLGFLDISTGEKSIFPRLNVGKQVDSWKGYKHVNKVNSNMAGKDHRKFFDYI